MANLPGIGELMIGGSAISSGAMAAAQAACLRAQAKVLQEQAQKYKEEWSTLAQAKLQIEAGAEANSFQILDQMNTISAQMRLMRNAYQKSFKQVQYIGIICVTIIFFLLLLKTFNLLGPIGEILAWPFVTSYRAIRNKV